MICIFCWKSWPGPVLFILESLPVLSLDVDEDDDDDDVVATAKDREVLAAGGEGEVCIM